MAGGSDSGNHLGLFETFPKGCLPRRLQLFSTHTWVSSNHVPSIGTHWYRTGCGCTVVIHVLVRQVRYPKVVKVSKKRGRMFQSQREEVAGGRRDVSRFAGEMLHRLETRRLNVSEAVNETAQDSRRKMSQKTKSNVTGEKERRRGSTADMSRRHKARYL